MRQWLKFGPVIIRIGSKHLAPWGYPRVQIGGLSLWTWSNTGQFIPASYHPKRSITWLWAVFVDPRRPWRWAIHRQEAMRKREQPQNERVKSE